MGKEIKVKIKDIAKLQFELEEDAQKGDWFDLNQINNYDLSSVEQALQTKKQAVEEQWKKEWSKKTAIDAVNAFKASNDYQELTKQIENLKLELTKQDKQFELEKSNLNNTIKENENAIQLKINNAVEAERKVFQAQIANLQKENTQLQDKVNTEKDIAIKQYLQSDEYKQLQKTLTELRVDNSSLTLKQNQTKKEAIDEFKNGEEYTNLQNKLAALEKANTILKEQNASIIPQYKQSEEFKKITTDLKNFELDNEQLKSQINKLTANTDSLKKEYELRLENQMLTERPKIVEDVIKNDERVIDLRKTIEEKDKELNYLRFTQRNTKLVGEALEKHLKDEYDKNLGLVLGDSASFEKTTENKDHQKPDFAFSVYKLNPELPKQDKDYRKLIDLVIIEAKNESIDSNVENRKKNVDHLKKLEKDRNNYGGRFGILVTNLEREQSIDIQIAPYPYENIFIVRPAWLLPLLSLLYFIIKKECSINEELNQYMKLDWGANTLTQLKQQFDIFKADILNKTIEKINKNFQDIDKSANSIIENAGKILEAKNDIMTDYFDDIKAKLTKISIDSMLDKIGKPSKKLTFERSITSKSIQPSTNNTNAPVVTNVSSSSNDSSSNK